jgi:hypothetical protein
MGIYENGTIFGIRIYDLNNILIEKIYTEIMSYEEKKKIYLFYTDLNNKNEIKFEYYTECSSTYGENDIFLMWFPMSLNLFLEKFGF